MAKFACAAMWAFEGDLRNLYAVTSAPTIVCADGEGLDTECSPKKVRNLSGVFVCGTSNLLKRSSIVDVQE